MSNTPTPTGYDVYWEKWIDAFEAEETDTQFSDTEEEPDAEIQFGEELDLGIEEEDLFAPAISHIQSIITPFGVLPLTEKTRASNYFKLWVGHSNFKLTKDFYKIIGRLPGIEALDILTPYRFRIAIGKLFVDRQIMKAVRDNMVSHMNGKPIHEQSKAE